MAADEPLGEAGSAVSDASAADALLADPARAAVAAAAVDQVEPGMVLGLGSGRALWALIELLGQRQWDPGLRVATASPATETRARAAGFDVVALDGQIRLDLVLDGADEVDGQCNLLKGHGAALLREKLLAVDGRRFVAIAEASKRVSRLGEQRTLPIEVVRFAWGATRRRLLDLLPAVTLLTLDDGSPLVTTEGHYLLHAELPPADDLEALAEDIVATVGVVEHGLFLGMADEVLLGAPDGRVERLPQPG